MLGTNEVKTKFKLEPEDIKNILIVCPPDIVMPESGIEDPRYIGGPEKIKKLPKLYKEVADNNVCNFIDAGKYITSSKVDGFHFEPGAHARLAEVLRDEILGMEI